MIWILIAEYLERQHYVLKINVVSLLFFHTIPADIYFPNQMESWRRDLQYMQYVGNWKESNKPCKNIHLNEDSYKVHDVEPGSHGSLLLTKKKVWVCYNLWRENTFQIPRQRLKKNPSVLSIISARVSIQVIDKLKSWKYCSENFNIRN